MEASSEYPGVSTGEGYAVAHLEDLGDGTVKRLHEGGLARVDAATVRSIRNVGDVDAVYVCAGGKDGYVGRDGRVPPGEEQRARALHDLAAKPPS